MMGAQAIFASEPALFRDSPRMGTAPRLTTVSRLDLPSVRAAELGATSSAFALDLGSWRRGALATGIQTGVATRVVRELPSIWQLQISNARAAASLHVSYDLRARDGRADMLSNADDARSGIRASIAALAATTREDGRHTIVEGGAVLMLDLSEARTAGRYSGTLTVTVNDL